MASVTFSHAAQGPPGAVAYACSRLGMRVFPLRRDIGTPVFTGWPERATTDRDQIVHWWTGEYAGCGVGVATGPESGIWVLDIDMKHGVNGFASLRELCARHECGTEPFARTMVATTPSGGAHVYFRWDEAADAEGGIRNDSSGKLGAGLDVRGIHGYVRAPEVNGYRIVERDGRKATTVLASPPWLAALCKQRRSHAADPMTNADVRARMSGSGRRWARFEAAEAVRRLERAPAGTRNGNLNKAAFRLGTLYALTGEPREETALAWCLGAMRTAGANDDEAAQLRTFDSGWQAGIAKAAEGTTKAADQASVCETRED